MLHEDTDTILKVLNGTATSCPSCQGESFLVPRRGTYLVFQLDPIGMVQPLGDAGMLDEVNRLCTKKYIGFVFNINELPSPGKPDHKCSIALVGQGLSKEDDVAGTEPAMCVPIFPATSHPLSREPVRPVPSFPLPGCYQYTSWTPTVRIPSQLYNHRNAVHLHPDDLFAHNLFMNEDAHRSYAPLDAQIGVTPSSDEREEDLDSSFSATSSFLEQLRQGTAEVGITSQQHQSTHDDPAESIRSLQGRAGNIPTLLGHADGVTKSGDIDVAAVDQQADFPQPFSEEVPPSAESVHDAASRASGTPPKDDRVSHPPDGTATPDTFMQAFVGDPEEARDLIPLVNISLDISEVSEVNDPTQFIEEVKEITRLIETFGIAHRIRSGGDSVSLASKTESWVDLAADVASLSTQQDGQAGRSGFRRRIDNVAFRFRVQSRRLRRRSVLVLKIAKAIATCSFTVRLHVHFELD